MRRWYYTSDNRGRLGPVTTEQLRQLALCGEIAPTTMVNCEGTAKWIAAVKLKGLFPTPPESSRFACPNCGYSLSAPEKWAGRSARCSKCDHRVMIPAPSPLLQECPPVLPVEEELPVAELFSGAEEEPVEKEPPVAELFSGAEEEPVEGELIEEYSPLTACSACGRSIAKTAVACPGCGAPNTWVHPEIVRFYQSIKRFDFSRTVQLNFAKFVLAGVDHGPSQDAQSIAKLIGSFGVIAPMNVSGLAALAAVQGGRQWAHDWARKKVKAFRIDFTYSPPTWTSTDDEWWRDVMVFFGLRRAKKKRLRKKGN